MPPKASINIVTVRDGGLPWQLRLLAQQTFKDFEVVIIDGFYQERREQIAQLTTELGLLVKHAPLPRLDYMTELTHSTNRNAALLLSDGEIIIFFDDYQMPAPNFVETHMTFCRQRSAVAVCQNSYYFNPVVDYSIWHELSSTDFEHGDFRNPGNKALITSMDPRSLWTNSSSAHIEDLRAVCGFDERYNGGTGGEDGDLGVRLSRIGCKLTFSNRTQVKHISHHHLKPKKVLDDIPASVDQSLCNHDRDPFTVNQYHVGDANLVEHGSLYTSRHDDGIKYYICKNCGRIGVIDSIEVLNASERESRTQAHVFERDYAGVATYAAFDIPRQVLKKLSEVYDGTSYTYYQRRLEHCA